MNKYPIWVGLVVAMVMVCLTSNPLWWMLIALGAGANGVACAANGWKMPVRARIEEAIRHRPMDASTRYKWLCDFIPTGFGKASIGDVLLAAGMLGAIAARAYIPAEKIVAALCLFWWGSGWAKGFGLFEKWTAEARRDARKNLPIMLTWLLIGNLLHVRGCSIGELQASASCVRGALGSDRTPKAVKSQSQAKYRDLGKLAPLTPSFLTRLKLESATNAHEAKARADEDAKRKAFDSKKAFQQEEKRIEAKAQPAFKREQRQEAAVHAAGIGNYSGFTVNCDRSGNCAVADKGKVFLVLNGDDYSPSTTSAAITLMGSGVISSGTIMINGGGSTMQPIGTRKGPFCRVTCTFACHNQQSQGSGTYDAETDAQYCKQNSLPEDAITVLGWVDARNGYEYQNGWPGPASEPGALKYKLYWK